MLCVQSAHPRTLKSPNCRIFKFSNCHILKSSNPQISTLSYFQIPFPNQPLRGLVKTTRRVNFQIISLSHYQIFKFPHPHILKSPNFQIIALTHYHENTEVNPSSFGISDITGISERRINSCAWEPTKYSTIPISCCVRIIIRSISPCCLA